MLEAETGRSGATYEKSSGPQGWLRHGKFSHADAGSRPLGIRPWPRQLGEVRLRLLDIYAPAGYLSGA